MLRWRLEDIAADAVVVFCNLDLEIVASPRTCFAAGVWWHYSEKSEAQGTLQGWAASVDLIAALDPEQGSDCSACAMQ
jgi:hypothetical protein